MDSEKINKIYNKQSYFAKYGKDVFASISIILFFTVLSVYFLLKSSLGSIKEKLKDNRCDAKYLFFSGWVSKREDQTEFGATTENMFICLNDLVKAAMVVFTDPFNDVINTSYLKSLLTTTTTNIFALEASTTPFLSFKRMQLSNSFSSIKILAKTLISRVLEYMLEYPCLFSSVYCEYYKVLLQL